MIKKLMCSKLILLVLFCLVSQVNLAAPIATVIIPPINQQPTNQSYPGKFIWHNLFTNDVEMAARFYSGMFGWESRKFGAAHNAYILFNMKGLSVAGVIQLEKQDKSENQWVSYISVDDVKSTSDYVTGNGGQVLVEPRLLEQHGQVAIFTDPEGAVFGVINSSSGDPREVLPKAGQFIWMDLLSYQPQTQIKFYKGIADYTVEKNPSADVENDFFLKTNSVARAGVLEVPDEGILPNWLPYVRVDNIVNSLVKTHELGGSVILEPSMDLHNGKLAVILDPTGAALGIVEIVEQ